jgi:hypothetical protein
MHTHPPSIMQTHGIVTAARSHSHVSDIPQVTKPMLQTRLKEQKHPFLFHAGSVYTVCILSLAPDWFSSSPCSACALGVNQNHIKQEVHT